MTVPVMAPQMPAPGDVHHHVKDLSLGTITTMLPPNHQSSGIEIRPVP